MWFKFVFFIKAAKCTFFDWKFSAILLHDVFKFIWILCAVVVVFLFHFLQATCSSINPFTAKCSQRQISTKILTNKQIAPYESTDRELSFEWSHHRISSADSKVRVTLQNSIKHSGSEGVKQVKLVWVGHNTSWLKVVFCLGYL